MSTKSQIQDFLSCFDKNAILLYGSKTNKKNMTVGTLDQCIDRNQNDQRDIYFYVNSGGRRKCDIDMLNACYIDLDAGRTEFGDYFNTTKVVEKKIQMEAAINKFPLEPHLITESRNGYQVFWLIDKVPAITKVVKQYEKIERQLYNYFKDVGADYCVLKVNQFLRVPWLKWHKIYESKDPFDVTCKYRKSISQKYTLNDLSKELKDQPHKIKIAKKKSGSGFINWRRINLSKNNVIEVDQIPDPDKERKKKLLETTAEFLTKMNKHLPLDRAHIDGKYAIDLANEIKREYLGDEEKTVAAEPGEPF